MATPQSANEAILQNMLGASNEIKPPQSRVEKLLQDIAGQMPEANPSEGTTTGTLERLKIGDDIYTVEGGGSGTSDYDALNNKPQIAGTTLSGNKSLADLGIASATALGNVSNAVTAITDGQTINSFSAVETALSNKQDTLTFDNAPTENSNNPVKSGGVYSALADKQNIILHGALDASGGVDGDLYLKTVSSDNMDVCGTPTANTGAGYEITTDVAIYQTYEAYKAFGNGDGFGKNGMGEATLVYHVTSGKKFKPSVISLCNNFDVSGGFLTSLGYVYGSADGAVWDTLCHFNVLSTKNESISFDITTDKFYSYFKFQFGGSGGYPGIKNIVIIGESDSEDDNRVDNVFYKQGGKWLKDAFAKKSDLDAKQDALTFDNAPTENSSNPVKSGGIYTALAGKVNTENGKGLSTNDYSDTEKAQVATNANDISSLKSGLTDLDNEVNGDATTYPYADVITIEDAVPANLADCNVKIEPVQDLHGYDKPWVGGAGKNKLPLVLADIKAINGTGTWSDNAYTINGVVYTVQTDNDGNVIGIKATGTPSGNADLTLTKTVFVDSGVSYILNGCPLGGSASTYRLYANWYYDGTGHVFEDGGGGITCTWGYTSGSNTFAVMVRIASGVTIPSGGFTFLPMVRLTTESDATFAPYTNYCPITGHTEASVEVTDGDETTKTYTIALGDTIYGGTVDFDSGVMTVTHAVVDMGDLVWNISDNVLHVSNSALDGLKVPSGDVPFTGLCEVAKSIAANDRSTETACCIYSYIGFVFVRNTGYDDPSEFKSDMAGKKICYELATPTTIQLTPQQIQLLKGTNTLTASTGQISVTVNGVSGSIGAVQEQVNDIAEDVADVTADVSSVTTKVSDMAKGYYSRNVVSGKWYKIADISATTWMIHNTIIAFNGSMLKHIVLRYDADSHTFNNNMTKINSLNGLAGYVGIKFGTNSAELYVKAAHIGVSTYTVLTDGVEGSLNYYKPIETAYTDSDMDLIES